MAHSRKDEYEELQDRPQLGGLSRRTVLKSTAVLIGASVVRGLMPGTSARGNRRTDQRRGVHDERPSLLVRP
jgi:hypothetical protein